MKPGETIGGRFQIVARAGAGASAVVYRATDLAATDAAERCVALKVFRETHDSDASGWIEREEGALRRLSHPAIVAWVAAGATADGQAWLAMDWLEGRTLAECLRAGRRFSVDEVVALGRRLGRALGHAAGFGLVHRDVKPSNVLLVGGECEGAMLTDFGLAHLRGSTAALTGTGMLVGTPGYMAPEQARGARRIAPSADVFALGCVLFECLSGAPAFEADHFVALLAKVVFEDPPRLAEQAPELPGNLIALVDSMLSKDPLERPADGGAVADALDAPPADPAVPSVPRLGQSERRLVCALFAGPPQAGGQDDIEGAARAVVAGGGTLVELLDGVACAVFDPGVGRTSDGARRAALVALELTQALETRRLALTTGWVVAPGLGRLPDRAASLLEQAAPRRVVVDAATANLLEPHFQLERSRSLRGGTWVAGPLQRPFRPSSGPFVGRRRERAMLEATVEEALEERGPYAVLITGGPGAGKTRLATDALLRAPDRWPNLRVVRAEGDVLSGGGACSLLGAALRHAAGLGVDATGPQARAHFLGRMGADLAADRREEVEFLCELARLPEPRPPPAWLAAARGNPMLMADRVREAALAWFEDILDRGPLLLVLEDLHWADLPSVELIDAALGRREGGALVVVATARPEYRQRFPSLWATRALTELRLSPLSRRAATRLVAHLGGDTLSEAARERVITHGAGNPLFLETLVRSGAEDAALPDTVLACVQAGLAGLPDAARRALRCASVYGAAFWTESVCHVLDDPEDRETSDWLAHLGAADHIRRDPARDRAGGTAWTFDHDLVRAAAYATLSPADRRVAHRLAGDWLEVHGELDAVVMAEHRRRGDQPQAAIRWYARAAGEALARSDLSAAISLSDRALDAGAVGETRGHLRSIQAEAHHWRDAPSQEWEAARGAVGELPARTAAWFVASARLASATGRLSDGEGLLGLAVGLLAAEPTGPDAATARGTALAHAGLQLSHLGLDGGPYLDAARAAADEAGHAVPLLVALVRRAEGVVAWYAGEMESSLRAFEASAHAYREAGDHRSAAQELTNAANLRLGFGQYRRACDDMESVREVTRAMGLPSIAALADAKLGLALTRLGDLPAGREALAQAMRWFDSARDDRLHAGLRLFIAENLALGGDVVQAEAQLQAALDLTAGYPPMHARARVQLAALRVAQGRPADAIELALEALETVDRGETIEGGEALLHLVYAEALEAAGDRYAARAALRTAVDHVQETAGAIQSEALRTSFLTGVSEHARIQSLARAWGLS